MQKMKRHDFSLTIIRVLDFVALVSLSCYALFNLLFNRLGAYGQSCNMSLYYITNGLVLAFCMVCALLATYNHFARKKLHWVEFGMAIATFIMTVILIVFVKINFDGSVTLAQKDVYMALSTILLEALATAITFAGTKIALVMSAKRDEKEQQGQ